MTYHPILSDQEHQVLIASLDLLAKNVGAQIANTGLGVCESGAGKLTAIIQLSEKLNASRVEPAKAVEASGSAAESGV